MNKPAERLTLEWNDQSSSHDRRSFYYYTHSPLASLSLYCLSLLSSLFFSGSNSLLFARNKILPKGSIFSLTHLTPILTIIWCLRFCWSDITYSELLIVTSILRWWLYLIIEHQCIFVCQTSKLILVLLVLCIIRMSCILLMS